MYSKKNPIEEIYKCSILRRYEGVTGGVPKYIFVFYGASAGIEEVDSELTSSSSEMSSEILTRLYNAYIEDGSNSKLFEHIFSKMELKNIATYDIKIYMIPFKVYSDDSIDVVKRKIMLAIKSVPAATADPELYDYAYDEMYLFSKTPVTFDSNEVYHKMTELALTKDNRERDKTSELDFLKTYVMGYNSSNGEPVDVGGVENILSSLKALNAREMFKDVPIGQSIPSNAYVNPFFFVFEEGVNTEMDISKIKSKINALDLLLNTKNIVHNTLFACFARDVIGSELNVTTDANSNNLILKTYYPLLHAGGLSQLESE